jgi:hypothetical protein
MRPPWNGNAPRLRHSTPDQGRRRGNRPSAINGNVSVRYASPSEEAAVMRFRTTMRTTGKTTMGVEIPPEVDAALGAGKVR